jgi:MinD-like ATPase involved in chromosome partitioning or flagellar assembly
LSYVVVGSAKASPGVTTLALGVGAAWVATGRRALVVEADPSGGSLAARLGLSVEPGVASAAVAGRRNLDVGLLLSHAQPVTDGLSVLCAPGQGERAAAAVESICHALGTALAAQTEIAAIVDVGRIGPGAPTWPLIRAAAGVVLVARPRLDEVQAVAALHHELASRSDRVGVVTRGEDPYRPEDVTASFGGELWAVVDDDPRGAAALVGDESARYLRRSPLWRSVTTAADALAALLRSPIEPAAAPMLETGA